MNNWAYTTLTAVLKTETLKLIAAEELAFIAKHKMLFLNQHPEIIFALNNDSMIVKQLTTVHEMMEQVAQIEEQEKQSSVSGASLTEGHRCYGN
jgi:hypothetical protein